MTMETRILHEEIEEAAAILREDGLVAVPTETVYGLAGNGLSEDAIKKIYEVKGRPQIKPLSLMVAGIDAMEQYCAYDRSESTTEAARNPAGRRNDGRTALPGSCADTGASANGGNPAGCAIRESVRRREPQNGKEGI